VLSIGQVHFINNNNNNNNNNNSVGVNGSLPPLREELKLQVLENIALRKSHNVDMAVKSKKLHVALITNLQHPQLK
jgi:hypothetical protein